MFKGLGGLGDMSKMMKAAQEMQGKMAQMQEEMVNIKVEGQAEPVWSRLLAQQRET